MSLGQVIQFIPAPPDGTASRVELVFDCDISTVVGDIVYQDTVVQTKVITNTNNTQVQPSLGVVIRKLSDTRCVVLTLGIKDGYSGLQIGSKAFLGTDGTITTTKPATGYVQTLGTTVSPTQIFFLPNTTRVLQTP